jgi:hypothetical protein
MSLNWTPTRRRRRMKLPQVVPQTEWQVALEDSRERPLMFSLVARCHGLCGWQK